MSDELGTARYFEYGQKEMDYLSAKDKKLGRAIERYGVIKREVNPVVFAALTESIVSQQISAKAAQTVYNRLAELGGITPENIHALSDGDVQSCGMSMRKVSYIKNAAEAAVSKAVDFDRLAGMTDREIIESLTKIKGVGVWTAEMLLIFSLNRQDVVSYGDLGIRRGIMKLYGLKELSKEKFAVYKRRYSPYGSVASLYLWTISIE